MSLSCLQGGWVLRGVKSSPEQVPSIASPTVFPIWIAVYDGLPKVSLSDPLSLALALTLSRYLSLVLFLSSCVSLSRLSLSLSLSLLLSLALALSL
jgi:hypothetical protein